MPAVAKCRQQLDAGHVGTLPAQKHRAGSPWATAAPAPASALMNPQCFSSILRHMPVYAPVSSCAFAPIYSCAISLKGSSAFTVCPADAHTGNRHTTLLLFPWAPLPRRSAPPVLPSFPALKWCQLELISPKHK